MCCLVWYRYLGSDRLIAGTEVYNLIQPKQADRLQPPPTTIILVDSWTDRRWNKHRMLDRDTGKP